MKVPGCHRSPVIRIPFTISSPIPQQPFLQQQFVQQPIVHQQLVLQQPTDQPLVVQQPFFIQQPFLRDQPNVQGFPQPTVTNQPFVQNVPNQTNTNQPINNQQMVYPPAVQPGFSQMVQPSAPAEVVSEKSPNQLPNVPTGQPPPYDYAVNTKM